MFLRISRQRLKSGKVIENYQLAESVWERKSKRARTNVVYNVGRVDDPAVVARLRKLARSILRRCSSDDFIAELPGWRVVDAWPFGDLYVLEAFQISDIAVRVSIAEQTFAAFGLGAMQVECEGIESGDKCEQTMGIECGDVYGEFVVARDN
jgi:hypothetical protein